MLFIDKVAIVTGAAMGNGRAIALGLASGGANLVVADIDLNLAEDTCREARTLGRRALAVRTNVAKKADVDEMVRQTLDEFGRVDILVNNAGVTSRHDLLDLPEEEWDRILDVNLKGVFLCTQAVARAMVDLEIKGKIINISSVGATRGIPYSAHYSASKAGVELFTQSAARALANRGVYVNAIAPGVIETPMLQPFLAEPGRLERYVEAVPLERIGQPQDLVGTVIFLAGSASDFVTGIVLRVDGGALA
jgi:NAD(P)-dependent dehydrogenase (short-subunit alcohol dehydrogenase family)